MLIETLPSVCWRKENNLNYNRPCKQKKWTIHQSLFSLCTVLCLFSRPVPWPATCPFGKRSSTCVPTSSRRATPWTHATTSSSPRRCARATWWRWGARSSRGRSAGSSSTASNGPSPTMWVRSFEVFPAQSSWTKRECWRDILVVLFMCFIFKGKTLKVTKVSSSLAERQRSEHRPPDCLTLEFLTSALEMFDIIQRVCLFGYRRLEMFLTPEPKPFYESWRKQMSHIPWCWRNVQSDRSSCSPCSSPLLFVWSPHADKQNWSNQTCLLLKIVTKTSMCADLNLKRRLQKKSSTKSCSCFH